MAANPTYDGPNSTGSKTELTAEGIKFKKPRGLSQRVSQFTRLEKIFLVLLFLLTTALIVVIVVLALEVNKDDETIPTVTDGANTKEPSVCVSTECVTAASNINAKIDYSTDPCDDFYQFACGAWMKGRVIPGDKSSVTTFSELRDDVDIIVKNLLEAEISDKESSYTAKAKTYYKSCLNFDLINKIGITPFVDVLNSELGGWPVVTQNWDENKFDLIELTKKINRYARYPLFAFYASTDNMNSTQRILKIDQSGLNMPGQKYYQVPRNDTMLMAYQDLILKHVELFNFDNANKAQQEQEVKDIVNFEIRLAEIMVPAEDRRDNYQLYNPMTLQEVATNYSQILDWKQLVYEIMRSPEIDVTDITDEEIIINRSPSYFEKLIKVLNETPKRTLANYMVWTVIRGLGFTQGDQVKDLYKDYRKALSGVDSVAPRYQTCVSYATSNVGMAVGKLFIKDNFDKESMTAALDMISDLHHSFEEILKENDWMDDDMKKVAEEKNRFIAPKIGYPEDLTNETYMLELYKKYIFHEDKFFENSLLIQRNEYEKMMKLLREPIDRKKADYIPSEVNAYYSAPLNQIMFPAGILQPPFFKKTFPKSLNYGGIGVVIGHEITHGFDDRGRQYDKDGNLVSWWSEDTIARFKTKSQCIVNQYSNYTMEGVNMNLNGINTQGENIADNGGLKQAFNAYRNWVDRQGREEDSLPGLKFSNDQLFFINFAQIWCSLMKDANVINRIRTGVHSPGRYRVIGTAQNSEDFSRAFKCPNTAKMNPKKKCSVW